MLGRYTTGPSEASKLYRLPSATANTGLGSPQSFHERFLTQGQGQIAARLFQNATRAVSRAPQATRQRIRVVQRDQERVDVVHRAEKLLAAFDLTAAQRVEQVPPQFADRLGEPVQERPRRNSEPGGIRQRFAFDQRQGAHGFDKLLLRILDGPDPVQVPHLSEREADLMVQSMRFREQAFGRRKLPPMDSTNGGGTRANQLARPAQCLLTRGVLAVELGTRPAADRLEVHTTH